MWNRPAHRLPLRIAHSPIIKIIVQPKSVGRGVSGQLADRGRSWGRHARLVFDARIKLPGVRIITGMFKFAVSAQVVAPSVGGSAKGTLESAGEVHVIVVSDVRHYFPTKFAAVQVTTARQLVKGKPHVPGF